MSLYPENLFLTLTYGKDCPEFPSKREAQLFVKRFRKAYGKPVRYFVCGELGSRYGRAHYHFILFGVPCTPAVEELCLKTWQRGFVKLKRAENIGVARYVAKYILKKIGLDHGSQDGQFVSWALMSRRPGIGRRMLDQLAASVASQNIIKESSLGLDYRTSRANWNPSSKITSGACVRLDGRLNPIDRYSKAVLFPEKEGECVTRLLTLINKERMREGGSFSVVLAEAERIHEERMRGILALKGVKESTL